MTEKRCTDCDHCGMDMDMDPYCGHPETRKTMPYGQALYTGTPAVCGTELRLWTLRRARTT